MKTFKEVLSTLIEIYKEGGMKAVDEYMNQQGLSEDLIEKRKELSVIFDKYSQELESLQKAKEDGKTREEWLKERIDNISITSK